MMTKDMELLLRSPGGSRLRSGILRMRSLYPSRSRSYWYRDEPNFGDAITPFLLRSVTGRDPIWVPRAHPRKVLSIGSVLDAVCDGDVIWGSGLIADRSMTPPTSATFLAVRGPLTRARLHADVPTVYGDPALLLPLYVTGAVKKQYKVGVVPHYVDFHAVSVADPAVKVIDVRGHWRRVVDDIRACEVILSSSLHGIVVAEAYGIPAVWIEVTGRLKGGRFKFDDYYLGTDRETSSPVSWERGIGTAVRRISQAPRLNLEPLLQAAIGLNVYEP